MKPSFRLRHVTRYAVAQPVELRQGSGSTRMTCFSRSLEPRDGFGIVGRLVCRICRENAEDCGGLDVAGDSRASQPCFRLKPILRNAASIEQRETQPGLRRTASTLGGEPVMFCCFNRIRCAPRNHFLPARPANNVRAATLQPRHRAAGPEPR